MRVRELISCGSEGFTDLEFAENPAAPLEIARWFNADELGSTILDKSRWSGICWVKFPRIACKD